jgi:hypothetical protein
MTRKFDAAREQAFLAALRASGNQTLAAERAKVSRAWVQRRRAMDPAFRLAVAQAVDAARTALRAARDERGGNGAGYAAGAELVVRGTGGSGGGSGDGARRVQIARARVRQWSPRVEERFLAALAATCNVKAACAEVGLSAASAYNHRNRWPAFARRWAEAVKLGHALLELALIEAAGNLFSGTAPVVPSRVGPVGLVREITADQAIHLLHMHKNEVHGLGKPPGRARRRPDPDAMRASILRKIEAIERAEEVKRAVPDREEAPPMALSAGAARD